MPQNAIENPVAMVAIGSTVDIEKGIFSRPKRSVLEGAITAMAATSTGRISLSGNIVKCTGVEYVDFDSLNLAEFIAALKP